MLTRDNGQVSGKVTVRELLELIYKIWVAQDKFDTLTVVRILELTDTGFHPGNGIFKALSP